jgi:diguanylate cyclase (GGDEF)-like protein
MYNRGKLDTELSEELARADRYKRPFTILLLDIDYFKLINDNHGHQVGDEVLKDIASIIRNQIRTTDTAGRWGGEEFLILCPETSLEGGKALAEKIRKAIEAHQYTIDGGITTSLGVTEYNDRDSMETLVKRADKALYEAKETGRNRTVAV